MNNTIELCCFCLNVSKSLIDLFSKSGDDLSHFDKISTTFSQLPNVLNEIDCDNYMLCSKCSDTIEMVYQFNQTCVRNVKIYSSQTGILESKREKECKTFSVEPNDEQFGEETNEKDFDTTEMFLDYPIIEDIEGDDNFAELPTESHNFETDISSVKKNVTLADKSEGSITIITRVKKGKRKRIDMEPNTTQQKKKSHQGNKIYACSVCEKIFTQSNNLLDHERIHSGIKPWICDVCGKSFIQKQHLNRHMLTHSDQKLHVCEECKKGFKRKDDLEKHKLCHSGERPHSCDSCERKFRDKSDLVKHKRIHTGEKPYACNVCNKAFNRNSLLINHRRIHTGERPYNCELCLKTFSTSASLYYHVLSHTGKKSYNCENCSKSFVQRCSLNTHKKKFNH